MTNRERKDFYLKRIKRILMFTISKEKCMEKLEEQLKIIMWNNPKIWANEFINQEVVPLLKRHGIICKIGKEALYEKALDYVSK